MMSEFINTIDQLGDEIVAKSIVDGSVVEIKDDILTKIRSYAFRNCKNLTSIDLPKVTSIRDSAFYGCSSLTTVNLPLVTSISGSAFYGCSSLTSIDLPLVTKIESSTFQNCSSLTSIDLPLATHFRSSVFYGCSSLKTVILRSNTMCYLEYTSSFTSTPIASGDGYIYVPRALIDTYKTATNWTTYAAQFRVLEDYTIDGTTTGEFVMPTKTRAYYDGSIAEVSSDEITTVGDYAFYQTDGVTTVNLPNATTIGNYAFQECSNLTSLNLPLVTSIGNYAFSGCSSLTTIDLSNIQVLNNRCFEGCKKLTTLIIRSGQYVTASENILYNCTLIESGTGYIYVPRDLLKSYTANYPLYTYKSQVRALEDYTVDGTTTGELDPNKI